MEQNLSDFPEGKQEPYSKPCPKCGYRTILQRKGPHIEWFCLACGHIKFMPQKVESFHMPIGKYKGKLLTEILQIDRRYLEWASENMQDNIAKKIKEIITRN
jgi:hypothetical protein